MQDLKGVLGVVAEALTVFAKGMSVIAGKFDELSQSIGDPESKPAAPKQKAAKTATPATSTTKTAKASPKKVKIPAAEKPAEKVAVKAAAKKPASRIVVKRAVKNKVAKPAPENKPGKAGNKEVGTASDIVLRVISDAAEGIGPGGIMEKTIFDAKKVSNIIHRLKQQGKIKAVKRGMYTRTTGDGNAVGDKEGNK